MMRPRNQGFSLIELLIVVAVILIIAAISIPGLLRSRMAANESSAVSSLRTINTAEITYAATYPNFGYSSTLAELGSGGATPCIATATTACLVDDVIAQDPALKAGYALTYTPGPGGGGPPNLPRVTYTIQAEPGDPGGSGRGASGQRGFFTDQTGVLRFEPSGPADASSAPLQ